MSEQKKKPTPDEIFEAQVKEFKTNLSGDLQKNAIDFAEYMKNQGGFDYLGECICFTVTDPDGNFYVFSGHGGKSLCNSNYGNFPIDESMKEFVWANINPCWHFKTDGKRCGCGQQPGLSFTIIGKKFDNLCNCPISFNNPDSETFEKIKRFVGASKRCIDANRQS
jgi:hypothetical protein